MKKERAATVASVLATGLLAGCSNGGVVGVEVASIAQFIGGGQSAAPLAAGVGPETARDCVPVSADLPVGLSGGAAPVQVSCFYAEDDDQSPAAMIERVLETVEDTDVVHLRLTLSPLFVDNSYGEEAIGWGDSKKGEHKFKELVGSDHAEMLVTDGDGRTALHFKLDYLSEDPSAPSGYGSLGVGGGKNDGEMIEGDADYIVGYATSLDRNFNGCGYDIYTEDSPPTDDAYTPSAEAPEWDYRVSYEVWIDADAFGSAGFGRAYVEFVHASPSKKDDKLDVEEGECPPGPPVECEGLDVNCGSAPPPPQEDDCPPGLECSADVI